ncbi:hypothetical protein VTJ83DRAFT_5176 [Remersonia thermophila]|uniref:Uncharacterized protein n=1 Tax=Remersonia thermophila TaxID=72144 RepID=A0ABR4DE96_9PEZI
MDVRTLLLLAAAAASGSCSPVLPDTLRGPPPTRPSPIPREALNLIQLPPNTPVSQPPSPAAGCTTTMSAAPAGYPCSWDGTTTIYPSTTTVYHAVNCNGCQHVRVIAEWYHCPNMRINGTSWANTPTTYHSTICQPSLSARAARPTEVDALATPTANAAANAAADADHDPNQPTRAGTGAVIPSQPTATATAATAATADAQAQGQGQPQPHEALRLAREAAPQAATACPTTLVVQPPRSAGRTATSYSSWTTSTLQVPCGGCDLFVSTALAGYGPPATFETTTTLPVGTVTAYACQ